MLRIVIHEEVAGIDDMEELLERIRVLVSEGYTSGYHPGWEITGEEEEE